MKNIYLAWVWTLVFPLSGIAQDTTQLGKNKGYLVLGAGLATPIGNFGSTSEENTEAGFASSGPFFDISFAYKFSNWVGIAATVIHQNNSMDEEALIDYFSLSVESTSVTSDSWTNDFIMGGIYLSLPLTSKATFDLRGLAGVGIGESSAYKVDFVYMGGAGWFAQTAGNGNGFAYLIGAGSKIFLGEKMCLLIHADFTGSTIVFHDVVSTIYSPSFNSSQSGKFEMDVQSFNFGAGIGFRL